MKTLNLRLLLALSWLLAASCGPIDEGPDDDEGVWLDDSLADGKADGSGLAVATQNLNAAMWHGYDPVFDRVTPNPCVDVADAELGPTEPRFRIPTLRFIRSRQQLAEELGIDLTVGGSLNVARAEVGFKLLNEFSRSSDRVAFMLRVTEDYVVLRRPGHGGPARLEARGRQLLENRDLNGFVSECGSHYVNGVRYGAEIDVLLTFSATDERHVTELTEGLGAEAVAAPVKLDAQARQRMESGAQDLDISITTAAGGFSLAVPQSEVENLGAECAEVFRTISDTHGETEERVDSLLADLVVSQQEALPRLFAHIDCLKELMHVSLARDANTCRTDKECTSGSAAPREVILEEYRAAQASDLVGPLTEIEDERRRVGRDLEALGSLRVRTRSAYWDEIAPFLSAVQEDKATFAVPTAQVASVVDLQRIADSWAAQLSPEPSRQGTIDRDVTRIEEDCRAGASNDLHHLCAPAGSAIESIPEYVGAVEALTRYQDNERIVPLQVVISPETLRYSIPGITDAFEYCEAVGPGYRLPSLAELPQLELLVTAGPVPGHTMWYSDDDEQCAISGAYYDPAADPPNDCSSLGARGTVCVSPIGLYPSLERL